MSDTVIKDIETGTDGKPTVRKGRSKSVDADMETASRTSKKKAETVINTPKSVAITRVDY